MFGRIEEVLRAADGVDRDALLDQLRDVLVDNGRLRSDNDRLKAENDALHKELERLLRQQGRGHGARKKRRAQARTRATGAGPRRRRPAPPRSASDPCTPVPVDECTCPHCGGELEDESWEHVSTTEIPKAPEPEVAHFEVQTKKCKRCGRKVRGRHPDVAPDQHGATAHRLGDRALAVAQTLHYGPMVTDRGRSYDAWQLAGVKQHKCSFHVLGSLEQVLEDKRGAARWFGLELKGLTQASVGLWNARRDNSVDESAYRRQADVLQAKVDWHLRERTGAPTLPSPRCPAVGGGKNAILRRRGRADFRRG